MSKPQKWPMVLGFAVSLVVSAWAGEFPDEWTWDRNAEARAQHAALEGKPMPGLTLAGWMNGEVSSADLNGKVVVLDFFATWCGPCMALIPHNNELLQKYKDQGLIFIGVCTSGQGQEKMAQTVKDRGITYPTARDPQLASSKAFQVQYFPTYAIVDRQGIVRSIGLRPEHVETVVKKLLAETPGGSDATADTNSPPPAKASPLVFAPAPPVHYGELALKGICGPANRRLALINNQTLLPGETAKVKAQDTTVAVTLKEIREDSVIIVVNGESRELKLGGR